MPKYHQACPLCNGAVEYSELYPHSICHVCVHKAIDASGEPVIFFHALFTAGGIQGYQRKNKELIPFTGDTCYIKGVKCRVTLESAGCIIFQPVFEVDEERVVTEYQASGYLYPRVLLPS